MTLSKEGLEQIAKNEGWRGNLYFDHKGYSIGFGHLCTEKEKLYYTGRTITEDEAKVLLGHDSAFAEAAVSHSVTVDLTQSQFDALVDFTYNVGPIALGKVTDILNKGNYKGAGAHMLLYDKVRVNGELKINPGLTERRNQNAKPFLEDERVLVGKL